MNRETSENISADIAAIIAEQAPYLEYSQEEVLAANRSFSETELAEFRSAGLLGEDFELFYVIKRFCDSLRLWDAADGDYIRALFQQSKKFDISWFYDNPYIKAIRVPDVRREGYYLTNATYDRGEFFQYDMPDQSSDLVVPKIGFFTGKVRFPSVYEGVIPWMSVCPSEIFSMEEPIARARGRVLVLGLGLGYYPFMISEKETVEEITIVEREPAVIQMFNHYLLPQFPKKETITVVCEDAFDYMNRLEDGRFDFCFADIWENQFDGAWAYRKIREHEERLPRMEFAYWIENSIRWYLAEEERKGAL